MTIVRKVARFAVAVVAVDIAANLIAGGFTDRYPEARNIAFRTSVGAAALSAIAIGVYLVTLWVTSGRYAVLALVLDERGRLLLYSHPHHKRMIPPGGRVARNELPHNAVKARLAERIGLTEEQYRFDERFHHGLSSNDGNLGSVDRVAAPFLVQRELRRQRSFVKFHYDFVYVFRLVDPSPAFKEGKFSPTRFVDLKALEAMVQQQQTFPDVLDAYLRLQSAAKGHST